MVKKSRSFSDMQKQCEDATGSEMLRKGSGMELRAPVDDSFPSQEKEKSITGEGKKGRKNSSANWSFVSEARIESWQSTWVGEVLGWFTGCHWRLFRWRETTVGLLCSLVKCFGCLKHLFVNIEASLKFVYVSELTLGCSKINVSQMGKCIVITW